MGIVALSVTMLESKLLEKIQIEDSIVPGCADILAQSLPEWVSSIETGVEVRIEKLSGPKRERRIEAAFGGIESFWGEEFFERVNENGFGFTVSNFVCE